MTLKALLQRATDNSQQSTVPLTRRSHWLICRTTNRTDESARQVGRLSTHVYCVGRLKFLSVDMNKLIEKAAAVKAADIDV